MKGIILSLYLDRKMEDVNDRGEFPHMSWSPYDRIQIKSVSSFNQFFEAQFQTKWVGVAQQMHLIHEYPQPLNWTINEEQGKEADPLIKTADEQHTYGLCAVVSVRLQKEIANTKKFRVSFYEELKKKAESIGGIKWNAFYSLGAEDIVFLLLSDDVCKIWEFVCVLNAAKASASQRDLFSAVSLFVNMNDINWKGDPHAGLKLRLNLKSGSRESIEAVTAKLAELGIRRENIQQLFLGKCVLDVSVPEKDVKMEWYSKPDNGPFNGETQFYKEYIASSRSYWVVQQKKDFRPYEVQTEEDWLKEPQTNGGDKNGSDIETLLEACKEIPIAQFVVKEYQRLINSNQSGWWSLILKRQFRTIQKFLLDYVQNGKMDLLYRLLRQLQNVLLHIRQSTISTTEVPYLNYIYAGSYNDVMKMYYGIVFELFQIGYEMEHSAQTKQYNITFCVDFESTIDIHSDMYRLSDEQDKDRLVVFHLPFDAFTDIEGTVKYLAHEVFHYIAPHSRERRNKILLDIWSQKVILRVLERLIKEYQISSVMEGTIRNKFFAEGSGALINKVCDEVYRAVKKMIPAYDEMIINSFMEDDVNLYIFRNVYHVVLDKLFVHLFADNKTLLDWIYQKTNEGKKPVDDDAEKQEVYRAVYQLMKTDAEYYYVGEEMKSVAHAYREAFCDCCVIKLFGIDAKEYLKLFYHLEIKRFATPSAGAIFEEAMKKPVNMDSLGRRIGMVLDELSGIESKQKNRIPVPRKDKTEDEDFIQFARYARQVDQEYLQSERLFRDQYRQLLSEIPAFWDENPPEKIKTIRDEFQNIKGCGNDLKKNIDIVLSFSNKNVMYEMTTAQSKKAQSNYLPRFVMEYHCDQYAKTLIENLGAYIEAAYHISESMIAESGELQQPCWYRGVCNDSYSLLPSLYRKYDKDARKNVRRSVYAYQTKILQDAYYLTMKMSALWKEQLNGIAEHTCCLQHYGMPTTLLDFSLDMLVALHFALQPDRESDRTAIDMGASIPKVVIFNPVLYNKAVNSLRAGKVTEKEYLQCSPVMFDAGDREMQDYFVYDMSPEKIMKSSREFFEEQYMPSPRTDLYPKPVIIQQTNSRVLAQNGIFVAYNLNALPAEEDGTFGYLDLMEIQNAYMRLFKNEQKAKKAMFLREIYIDPFAGVNIRKELNIMGMSKSKMYPELSEIFKEYSEAAENPA